MNSTLERERVTPLVKKKAESAKKKNTARKDYERGEAFPEQIAWIRHRLRLYREKRGMTQVQLADKIGAVRGRITDIERSEKQMADFRIGTVFRIIKAMGVAPETFFKGCPDFGVPQPSSVIVTSEDDIVTTLLPMLNEAQIKRVLNSLRKQLD